MKRIVLPLFTGMFVFLAVLWLAAPRAEAVEQAKCNLCHAGKDKKTRNAYGAHLSKLLDKKADAKNAKKILTALEQVAQVKSDPKDAKSSTFGQLISQGKLPIQPSPEKKADR